MPEPKNLKVEDLSKSVKQVPHSGHEMHCREMLFTPRGSQHGKERYFYQLLKVFRPRRDEQNIYSPEQTYEAAFVEKSEHLPAIVEYDRKNRERIARDEKFDDAVKQAADDQNRLNSDVEDDKGAAFEGCAVDNAEMAMHDVLDTHRMATATDRHSADDLQEAYDVH